MKSQVVAGRPAPRVRRLRPERTLPLAPLPAGLRPKEPLPDPSDWTFDLIEQYHEKIRAVAARYALDTASRGYVLQTGRIMASGTCEALRQDARVKEAYLGSSATR